MNALKHKEFLHDFGISVMKNLDQVAQIKFPAGLQTFISLL